MTRARLMATTAVTLLMTAAGSLLAGPATTTAPAEGAGQVAPMPLQSRVQAELRVWQAIYRLGQPVWVEFSLRNLTGETVTLQVPNAMVAESSPPAMGLPLTHVFSGPRFGALQITRESDQSQPMPVLRQPSHAVAPIELAPYASVGVHVDASRWYASLRQPGEYRLEWKPYGGQLTSNAVTVKVANFKDAVIHTDLGDMRVRLYYKKAPKTVENFLSLARSNFYDSLALHRVLPGFLVQGGSPTGDDAGMQPDGTRVPAEFNDTRFERGTVAMARSPNDPDSASSQFFITFSRQKELDGQYTAFGELVGSESFDTLSKIEQVQVERGPFGELSRPARPIRIQSISLEDAPRPPMKIHPLGGPPQSGPGLAQQ